MIFVVHSACFRPKLVNLIRFEVHSKFNGLVLRHLTEGASSESLKQRSLRKNNSALQIFDLNKHFWRLPIYSILPCAFFKWNHDDNSKEHKTNNNGSNGNSNNDADDAMRLPITIWKNENGWLNAVVKSVKVKVSFYKFPTTIFPCLLTQYYYYYYYKVRPSIHPSN